jgi:hypothetical protein
MRTQDLKKQLQSFDFSLKNTTVSAKNFVAAVSSYPRKIFAM